MDGLVTTIVREESPRLGAKELHLPHLRDTPQYDFSNLTLNNLPVFLLFGVNHDSGV